VSDNKAEDSPQDAGGSDDLAAYESPRIEVTTDELEVADAELALAEGAPDDTLGENAAAEGPAEVLGWATPQVDYVYGDPIYGDPKLFVAPSQPGRKASGPKRSSGKTHKSGKKTVARSVRTTLKTRDAFGGLVCTCDNVCTCYAVCTCEAVCTCVGVCSCVGYTPSGGGGGSTSTCSCVPVCTCVPVAH